VTVSSHGRLRVIDVKTGTVDCGVCLWAQFAGQPAMLRFFTATAHVAVSAAGDAVALGSADGRLVVVDAWDGSPLLETGVAQRITAVAFQP